MSTDGVRPGSVPNEQLLRVWEKSEEVAMHFNELLQNFRLKAIGGVTIFAAITLGMNVLENREPEAHNIISWFFYGLALVWALVALLDFFYYHRLLAGAVDELLRVERRLGDVFLSHQIEHRVHHGFPANGTNPGTNLAFLRRQLRGGRSAGYFPATPVVAFYFFPLLALLFAGWYIGEGHCCEHHCEASHSCEHNEKDETGCDITRPNHPKKPQIELPMDEESPEDELGST